MSVDHNLFVKLNITTLSQVWSADSICRLRGKLNSLQEASGGKRISVNDLVIKVLVINYPRRTIFKTLQETHGRMVSMP